MATKNLSPTRLAIASAKRAARIFWPSPYLCSIIRSSWALLENRGKARSSSIHALRTRNCSSSMLVALSSGAPGSDKAHGHLNNPGQGTLPCPEGSPLAPTCRDPCGDPAHFAQRPRRNETGPEPNQALHPTCPGHGMSWEARAPPRPSNLHAQPGWWLAHGCPPG